MKFKQFCELCRGKPANYVKTMACRSLDQMEKLGAKRIKDEEVDILVPLGNQNRSFTLS